MFQYLLITTLSFHNKINDSMNTYKNKCALLQLTPVTKVRVYVPAEQDYAFPIISH